MADNLIDFYRSIEDGSVKMLQAARHEDWEQVARFECVCAVLISQLRVRGKSEQLESDQQQEKARIMQRILINDAQIRNLVEPKLESLGAQPHHQGKFLH